MATTSPSRLESLPARPPTPPREADKYIDDAIQFLSDSFEVEEATGNAPADPDPAFMNTPPQHSPSTSAEQPTGSGRRKKVDFSPWTAYHSVNDLALSRRGLPGSPLRPLPQPRDPKTLKSILKAHEPPVTQPSTPNSGHTSNTSDDFATMLNGLVQQLAGSSRFHKLDAYMALLNTLKTYEGKPDAKALAGKVDLLAQFIKRDMTATNSQTGGLDVQLALQALKLLVALMEIGHVAARIPEVFRTFFLDKAIETFSDATAPKQWVNHILHAFNQQQFTQAMTADRANRAISALKDIEDRISGNNVIIGRMLAYQTLLGQQKLVMVSRSSDWIQHIFHGFLSSNKDIRKRAVELCTVAGIVVGEVAQVSRVTMEILAKELDDGKTYGEYFTGRLVEMLSEDETAPHVPLIWSAVGLLLRNRRRKLESWKLLKDWLHVFQSCVNSSNREAAIQANGAWNRFVYALRPDQSTPPKFRNLLRQAIVAQFNRKGGDKDALRMKRSVFSSYCNLLYYALPPTAPVEQLDLYWQEFVVEGISAMIEKERKGAFMACKVLTALFKRNTTKLWNENLAVESPTISLENIMALDARWTRQRLGHILPPVERCLALAPWTYNFQSDESPSDAPVKTMWTVLMSTVSDAGSKEVTASMDFKEACAQIMSLFRRLWMKYPESLGQDSNIEQTWIDKFGFLVLTTVELLGPSSFADPILSLNSAGEFEVAPTPSHRPKSRGSLQSPLLHLLRLFVSNKSSTVESASVLRLSERLLDLCCQAKKSRKSKLELLRNYVQESRPSSDSQLKAGIWRKCAREAEICLKNSPPPTSADRVAQSLGEEYCSVLDILICGLDHGTDEDLVVATHLYDTFVCRVQHEVSDGASAAAVALAITEPLSEILQSPPSSSSLNTVMSFATLVLRHVEHPRHRRSVEQARRALWGVSTGPQKPADFDPFNHLYKMIVSRLQAAYESLEDIKGDLVIGFSAAFGALLQRWPVSFSAVLLRKVQSGIVIWIEDPAGKLSGGTAEIQGGRHAVYALWDIVMACIEHIPKHDSMLLKALEALLVAGLRSKRQRIVNVTIEMWNKNFGAQAGLEYPSGVEKSLRRLRPIADLQLPDFPEGALDDDDEPAPTFEDSQEDIGPQPTPFEIRGPSPLPRRLDCATSAAVQSEPALSKRAAASNSKPKAKLRHDDSQLDFAPIPSSPTDEMKPDSQLLTDHQKEVRERQQEAAAMFPDISSSPTPPIRDRRLGSLAYSKPVQHLTPSGDGEPRPTPTLNLQEYNGHQDIPSSSPTPKSRRGGRDGAGTDTSYITSSAVDAFFDTNIPSSPPGLDDDDALPTDLSFIKESFVIDDRSTEAARKDPLNGLESQLDDDVVAQLVGDVTNLSEANVSRLQRESSFVSVSSRASESELASSEIDEEVSQQLENEVIAQALREREASFASKKQYLPSDTVLDESKQVVHSDTAGDMLNDLLGDGEGISSFDDIAAYLPQGTAGTVSEPAQRILLEDANRTPPSPTEKDTSSIDLPIRSSPARKKPSPGVIQAEIQNEEIIVEDSFVALDSRRFAPNPTSESKPQTKQPTTKIRGHRKRKSETIAESSLPLKRPKTATLSSNVLPDAQNDRKTGSDSDSDDSLLSNICVDTSSIDGLVVTSEASSSEPHRSRLSRFSKPEPESEKASVLKGSDGRKAAEQALTSSRASPRLSVTDPEPALMQFSKRKTRLSQSQATDPDDDETRDVSAVDGKAVQETPAPKKRRGRKPKGADSQASSQASDAPSTVKKSDRGSTLRGTRTFSHVGSAGNEGAAEEQSRITTFQGIPGGSKATAKVLTEQKKRKRSCDGRGVAGGTPGPETHASEQAASQQDPDARQGSTAADGSYGEASDERPKLQPRSIIERLKRVLSDCRQLVLGRTEEREIDDVMFELRREVHEAARRGERQSGN